MKNKSGFTLVEILVVVLIIGILTAVAIPMYQSAVDKTHWSTLLPTARALKNAEEAYLMATNVYTDNADALDVAATEGDATYELQMPDSAARYVIRGSTTKLPNVRLAQYLDDNASYADLLFCEAAADNDRANKLCEKTLNGHKVYTTADSYNAYLMDSPCRKSTNYLDNDKCGFENTKNQEIGKNEVCIGSETLGCQGSKVQEGGVCIGSGAGGCRDSIIKDGGTCQADAAGGRSCQEAQVYNGGKCVASSQSFACYRATIYEGGVCETVSGGNTGSCIEVNVKAGGKCIHNSDTASGCNNAKVDGGAVICNTSKIYCGLTASFNNGGVCVGNYGRSCYGSSFKNGSICYANAQGACDTYGGDSNRPSQYDSTSCCCGKYCGSAPKCADRGKTCDPQYM